MEEWDIKILLIYIHFQKVDGITMTQNEPEFNEILGGGVMPSSIDKRV